MQKYISPKLVALTFGALVLCFAISFYVFGWYEPTTPPPGDNVDTPINVGNVPQEKYAELSATLFSDTDDKNYYVDPAGSAGISAIFGENVGIGGTTNPAEKLDVVGNIKSSGTYFAGNGSAATPAFSFSNYPNVGMYSPNGSLFFSVEGVNLLTLQGGTRAIISTGGGQFRGPEETSATAPAFTFVNDTRTGTYNPSDLVLGFTTDGVERMRISPSGNVGIGTMNPGAKLEIAGQIKITGGSPGAGKVLTSDANGLASWQSSLGKTYRIVECTDYNAMCGGTAACTASCPSDYVVVSAGRGSEITNCGDAQRNDQMRWNTLWNSANMNTTTCAGLSECSVSRTGGWGNSVAVRAIVLCESL